MLCLIFSTPCFAMEKPTNIIFDASLANSPIKGFVQTPIGGTPGTSSPNRPTLTELGITHQNMGNLNLQANWKDTFGFIGIQLNQMKHTSTLQQALMTHGVLIHIGTTIHSKLKFNLYHIGGGYQFHPTHHLTLSPTAILTGMRFDYEIASYITPRRYNHYTLELGAQAREQLTEKTAILFEGAFSSPGFNELNVKSAKMKLSRQIYQHQGISSSIYAGLGVMSLDFKDTQPMPNHLHISTGMQWIAGFRVSV